MKKVKWSLSGIVIVLGVGLIVCAGCQTRILPVHGDPNDPNRVTSNVTERRIDPNIAGKIVTGGQIVQGGAAAGTGIPVVGPILGLLAGLISAGLGVWAKIGPQLTQYKSDYEQANAVAQASVTTIEELKKAYPEVWAKLSDTMKEQLEHSGINFNILDNIIRGLRGLPPKA